MPDIALFFAYLDANHVKHDYKENIKNDFMVIVARDLNLS